MSFSGRSMPTVGLVLTCTGALIVTGSVSKRSADTPILAISDPCGAIR
jgi:hypothetical protein